MLRYTLLATVLLLAPTRAAYSQSPDTLAVQPSLSTAPVQSFSDDPAIWIHPTDPAQSLILGTDKGTYPNGGIFVWNLDGSQQQRVNESHPNNVDVAYGMRVAGSAIDLAVASMRDHDELFVYKINPDSRQLEDITSANRIATVGSPFGLALYHRKSDGEIFAFVSSRNTDAPPVVQQMRLFDDGSGGIAGEQVRLFSNLSDFVDGIVVDSELGYVYFAEEGVGVSKYAADPNDGDQRLAMFATDDGITGNREGLALYGCADSTGYILLTSPKDRVMLVYPRAGGPGGPHDHQLQAVVKDSLRSGDGIAVTNRALSPNFSNGLLVWQDAAGNRFQLYAWEDVAQGVLQVCTDNGPASAVEIGSTGGPRGFQLRQNYPNPFNPQTTIQFQLTNPAQVKLTVFNVLGEEIKTLLDSPVSAGLHIEAWDGHDDFGRPAASGTYIYRFYTTQFSQARKMTLSR